MMGMNDLSSYRALPAEDDQCKVPSKKFGSIAKTFVATVAKQKCESSYVMKG